MRPMARLALITVLALAACKLPEHTAPAPSAAPPARPEAVGMANPASVACVRSGGELVSYSSPEGVTSYCRMSDGRQCEEWALFRDGKCEAPPPGASPDPRAGE